MPPIVDMIQETLGFLIKAFSSSARSVYYPNDNNHIDLLVNLLIYEILSVVSKISLVQIF